MRWPWVSRRLYDAREQLAADQVIWLNAVIDGDRANMAAERERLTAALTQERERSAAALEAERKRGDFLLDVVLNMRMTGATVTRTIAPDGRLPQRKRSDVDQAIDENRIAGSNPRLRAYLSTWASKEIARGVEVDRVLDQLRTWSVVKDEATDDDDEGETEGSPTEEAIAL